MTWGLIEDERVTTSDGFELGGWLVRGDPTKPSVVVLHGVGDSRRGMLSVIECLADARFTVLAISMRAHGDSSGDTNDFGWSARHDVVAAVRVLQKENPGHPIYLLGRSMGAAAAIFAAKELQSEVAGYFLEEPYQDLNSAVWNRMKNHLAPGFDVAAYEGLKLWAPLFLPVDPQEISPLDKAVDIPASIPVVLLAGSVDRHAPAEEVRAILQQVRTHGNLVVFEGAAHEALDHRDPARYRTTLLDLMK